MKKIWLIAAVLLVSIAAVSCQKDQKGRVRFATGGTAGTYFAYGSAIAQVLQENTGISVVVQSTGASRANIQLISMGEVEIAFSQNDVMFYAWNGTDLFAGEQTRNFGTVAGLYSEVVHVVANAGSGITSVADLRGRSVSVGDAGSGVEFNSRQILEAHGLSFDDIRVQNLGFGASADALRDGQIDAFFVVAGAPVPALIDLATTRDISILEIDSSYASALRQEYPFYSQYTIPAGTYRGLSSPVNTVAVSATLLARTSLSEDTVYEITKALFENQREIATAHARGNDLSPESAVEAIPVPLHPGAERFFREIGVIN